MRHPEPRLVHAEAAVEQEIEVEGPRPACGTFAGPPELRLDGEEEVEECAWRQGGLERRSAVQKARLIGHGTDRVRFAEGRDGDDLDCRIGVEALERRT